mgnify:CR=1 FL=1
MAKSSSAKVARLAQKGKTKKVRFQGGTVFPAVILVVCVLGLGLIFYSRSEGSTAEVHPTVNDHWHMSYGIDICNEFQPNLAGNKENPLDPNYEKYRVHSHDDGVIHWHPSSLATGKKAKLGVFFKVYGITVNDTKIIIPKDAFGAGNPEVETVYEEGKYKCDVDGKKVDGVVKVRVWDTYDAAPEDGKTYISAFNDIRMANDQMAITIAFVPDDTTLDLPPTASSLPDLGAVDSGGTTTTVAGDTTTTVSGETTTTVSGETTTTVAADTTTTSAG